MKNFFYSKKLKNTFLEKKKRSETFKKSELKTSRELKKNLFIQTKR